MSKYWKQDLLAGKVPRNLKEADLLYIPEAQHMYAREIIALRKEVRSLRKQIKAKG